LRWLSPLEPGLAKIIKNYKRVIVAELNMGQLRQVIRATYLIDAIGLNKIQGMPFKVSEVTEAIERELGIAPGSSSTAPIRSDALPANA
jgi:2-oxoglutarate ferredoxin oxidoreductase subunit alpha